MAMANARKIDGLNKSAPLSLLQTWERGPMKSPEIAALQQAYQDNIDDPF